MALTTLPPELLEPLIEFTIPNGFENLALSCKDLYALCRPFLTNHNKYRRRRLCKFKYRNNCDEAHIGTASAYRLIAHISREPPMARYIQVADFRHDGIWETRPLPEHTEAVAKLLQSSPLLREARIEPGEFQAEMEADLRRNRYSQGAAAFLLTLLPNLEQLRLPFKWDSSDESTQAILATINERKIIQNTICSEQFSWVDNL